MPRTHFQPIVHPFVPRVGQLRHARAKLHLKQIDVVEFVPPRVALRVLPIVPEARGNATRLGHVPHKVKLGPVDGDGRTQIQQPVGKGGANI
jgi:hypothetical protein